MRFESAAARKLRKLVSCDQSLELLLVARGGSASQILGSADMGCSASVPAPAPAAEPEDDAPVVPGAHVPQRMSMSELGRQLTSSSMGMHLSRNSAPAATKRRSSLFRRQSKEELPPAVRINPLTDLFDEFTPMVGMLFDDFKKCGHIPRSDEARREGWLTEFDPEVHQAVFVSQNWWRCPSCQT